MKFHNFKFQSGGRNLCRMGDSQRHYVHLTLCKVVAPVFMGNLLESGVVTSCIDMISLIYTIDHSWLTSTYWHFLRGSQGGALEWVANKWHLDKLSPISNDISTWLLHDLSRTMRQIAIKNLIKVCVSLFDIINWHLVQTHRFPYIQIYWPEYLETTFITAAFWCAPSEQPTDLFVSRQMWSCVFLLLGISLYTMVTVNYRLIHLIRTWDRAFPSMVKIILCTKWIWRWWLRSCIRGLRYRVWRDRSYCLRADLVGVLAVLSWSSPASNIGSDTLSSIPCLTFNKNNIQCFF